MSSANEAATCPRSGFVRLPRTSQVSATAPTSADDEEDRQQVGARCRLRTQAFPDPRNPCRVLCAKCPVGKTTEWFTRHGESSIASGVEVTLVINAECTQRLQHLVNLAARDTRTPSEPAYRLLQILTHTRGGKLTF